MAKPSHSTTIVGLLLGAGAAWAVVSAATTSTNPDRPPEAKFETGVVRVWNEKAGPPVERDHTPEAKLGDAIIVELKNLDQWFAANLEAGAWAEEEPVAKADPAVLAMIKDHQLVAAAKVGEQLEILAALISYVNAFGNENAPEPSTDVSRLSEDPDAVEQLGYVQYGEFKDDKGNAIDPLKLTQSDVPAIVDRCSKALHFIHEFTAQKMAKFLLTINDIPLPGLLVETPKREAAWRTDDTSDLEIPASYNWFEFRLRGGGSSTGEVHHQRAEFAKAWTHLMEAGKTYSKPSTVALSLPGQKNSLPTNVTPTSEDPRCRFNLLIARPPSPTPGQTHFKMGDAVYPLDERDLDDHVLKASIVEEPDAKSDSYLVHFDEKGGTDRYAATELARLPPDLIPAGVVRVWNDNQHDTAWENAQKYEIPAAKMGDTLMVELRNFDVWLARQIDNGLFQDDPLLHQATQASKNLENFIKDKRFANTVKVGRRIQRLLDDSPHMKGRAIVESLHQEAKHEDYLAALDFPKFSDESVPKITPPEKQSPAPVSTPPPVSQGPAPQSNSIRAPSQMSDAARRELQQQQRKAKADADDAKETQEQKIAEDFLAPYKAAYSALNELVASKLRTLTLTINDIPLGITPDNADYEPVSVSRRPGGDPKGDVYYWLPFSLRPKSRGATQEEAKSGEDPFKRLMAHPKFTMSSKVALALKSGTEMVILPTAVTQDAPDPRAKFNLIGIEKFKFYPMVLVFVLILGSLAFFAASTDILRDPCRRRPEGVEPVSLARTQMAFWFVVIAAAFAFLWVTTGNIDTINGTCLTLLAIGTTTALTAVAIQGQRSDRKDLATVLQKTPHEMLGMRPTELKEAMEQRKQELETVGATTMTPDEIAEEKAILKRHETEIECLEKRRPKWLPRRIYFWRYRLRTVFEDLLTEEAGTYDFHRFQMLAWTLVLGAVFVAKVFTESTMPQFDSNLLLLMGISSGAYLGFKMAGPRKTSDDPPKSDDNKVAPKPA